MNYEVKDSGERLEFASGMVRDVTTDKTDYSLVLDGPMFERWANHLSKGAQKYSKRNWMLAEGDAELERFRESAFRHFLQWYYGDLDEDHAAAVFFNINGAEYVRGRHNDSTESHSDLYGIDYQSDGAGCGGDRDNGHCTCAEQPVSVHGPHQGVLFGGGA